MREAFVSRSWFRVSIISFRFVCSRVRETRCWRMASMRLNIPTVFVSGGPMEAGKAQIDGKEAHLDLVDAGHLPRYVSDRGRQSFFFVEAGYLHDELHAKPRSPI